MTDYEHAEARDESEFLEVCAYAYSAGAYVLVNVNSEFRMIDPSGAWSALTVCPNCEQWQREFEGNVDCFNRCTERGFAN